MAPKKKTSGKPAPARKKAAAKKKAGVARKAGGGHEDSGQLVEIRNFGPIVRADLRMKNLTVLAGPNKTGKTFASKLLHSVFGVMNANHLEVLFQEHAGKIRDAMRDLWRLMPMEARIVRRLSKPHLSENRGGKRSTFRDFFVGVENQLDNLGKIVSSLADSSPDDPDAAATFGKLADGCVSLRTLYRERANDIVGAALSGEQTRAQSLHKEIVRGHAAELEDAFAGLANVPWTKGGDRLFREGAASAFYRSVASNFQVHPNRLSTNMKGSFSIKVEGVANFIVKRETPSFDIPDEGIDLTREQSRVLFLDSPIYWRLQSSLIRSTFPSSAIRREGNRLAGGAPQYFYDLVELLNEENPSPPSFPEPHKNLSDAIGGEIILSKTGMGNMLFFQEIGVPAPMPMHVTATGVVNLGFLSLLLEKNLIDKDTYVFIDEPESNLHPEWQVKMAETLYELARGGVNIVLATHSIDILKRLEIYAKEDVDAKKLMAVNHFALTDKGAIAEDDSKSLESKISAVMKELSSPFFDLYVRGL